MTDNNRLGRPKLAENEPTVKTSITIPESYREFLRVYGRNNISDGVRRLVEEKLKKGENDGL